MEVLRGAPQGYPALVLNADFRPLSYYPLSLWPWQEVIKAVFLDRVDVVSTYDNGRPLALLRNAAAERGVAEAVCGPGPLAGLHPLQPVPARRLHLPVLRLAGDDLTFDHVVPRSRGGRTTWENIVTACAPCNLAQGRPHAARGAHDPRHQAAAARPCTTCRSRAAASPNHLHASWLDYLYWDIELEARRGSQRCVALSLLVILK